MISTLTWISRGIAKKVPLKYQMDDAEYKRICELTKTQLDSARADLDSAMDGIESSKESNHHGDEKDDDLAIYKMDEYDNEEESGKL